MHYQMADTALPPKMGVAVLDQRDARGPYRGCFTSESLCFMRVSTRALRADAVCLLPELQRRLHVR